METLLIFKEDSENPVYTGSVSIVSNRMVVTDQTQTLYCIVVQNCF